MKDTKYAKVFMKMARFDCNLLKITKVAGAVLTAAAIINALISCVYIVTSLKKA